MGKKILLLTAGKTGGHRSASNALKAALLVRDPELEVLDYDSNLLFLGYRGEGGEQGYVTMTTRLRFLWKIFFELTSLCRPVSNFFLSQAIKTRFLRLLRKERPDIVVSLHPCFVGSVLRLLRREGRTPFAVVVLDPVKHSRLWRDKRADLSFLPTEEAKEAFLRAGFPEEKVLQCGFPLSPLPLVEKKERPRKKLLFVNPSQKSLGTTKRLIEAAYPFDVDIDVVTGSDVHLRKYLERHLKARPGLSIFGYVDDMARRLREADLLLTKAGPNIMFEAIAAQIPVVFTGHLPGQEEKNALYAVRRGYGFAAERPSALSSLLKRLLVEEPNLLSAMREREGHCPDLRGAERIAEVLVQRLRAKEE